MKQRVAILISGGGSNMLALLNSMDANHPGEAVLVMSNVAGAGGIGIAAQRDIATAIVDHRPFGKNRAAFEDLLHEQLIAARVDIICTAGFMRILTGGFIKKWSGRMLNIHPSLLPKYKGLRTHERAIAAGDTVAGCSVHEVTPELDGGPVLGRAEVPVLPGDTAQGLAARVLVQEHLLYPKMLRQFLQDRRAFG